MISELRKTGLDMIGDIPWGSHFCNFYETKQDLLDILMPYFMAGLKNKEFCLWVLPDFMTPEEAMHAWQVAVVNAGLHKAQQGLEIIPGSDWYLKDGQFDRDKTMAGWNAKIDQALARGFAGVRATGDKSRIDRPTWSDFCDYEMGLNSSMSVRPIIILCTYPITECGAADILDVTRSHQFSVARRHGSWEVLETQELKKAKEEIRRMNEELEWRISERTRELAAKNEELATERDLLRTSELNYARLTETLEQRVEQAVAELRQKDNLLIIQGRQALMGEMINNIAHHWRQPLNSLGILTQNLQMVSRQGQASQDSIDSHVKNAMEIIRKLSRTIDAFTIFSYPDQEKVTFCLADVIKNVLSLLEENFKANGIRFETQQAGPHPMEGFPNELSQVILNILINAKDAFLARQVENPVIAMRVFSKDHRTCLVITDNAGGIPVDIIDKIFDPYFTTKGPQEGTGLGLFISKTIVEKRMKGSLSVRNAGDGAEFTIEI